MTHCDICDMNVIQTVNMKYHIEICLAHTVIPTIIVSGPYMINIV